MKRQAGVLCLAAIWLIIVATPALRLFLRLQIDSGSSDFASVWPHDKNEETAGEWSDSWLEEMPDDVARRFPDDVNVQYAALTKESGSGQATTDALDKLIARFPRETWLIAARLRQTLEWMQSGRADKFYPPEPAGSPLPPGAPATPAKRNITQVELNKAIELCRRGRALEPNNAFFDWALAQFLVAAFRDDAALDALASGAKKTRYDEYQMAVVRARVRAKAAVLNRPLLWEERMSVFEFTPFTAHARYRDAARWFAWQGMKAQGQGRHARALEIYRDLMRIGQSMREGSETHIQGLIAIALEGIALQGPTRATGQNLPAGGTASRNAFLNNFQSYANRHGRHDLALAAGASRRAGDNYLASVRFNNRPVFGLPDDLISPLAALWQAGVLLLLLLLGAVGAWLVSSALIRRRRMRIGLESGSTPVEHFSWRERMGGVLACSGISPLFYAALLVALAAPTMGLAVLLFEGEAALQQMLNDAWTFATTLSSLDEYWDAILHSVYGTSWLTVRARWMIALLPLVIGVLFSLRAAVRRQKMARPDDEMLALAPLSGKLANRAFDPARALGAFIQWLFYLGACAMWFITLSTALYGTGTAYWLMTFGLFFINIAWLGLDWSALPGCRDAARYAVLHHRRALTDLILLGSALYLLCLLVAVPLRKKADLKMSLLLNKGEVAAWRQPSISG